MALERSLDLKSEQVLGPGVKIPKAYTNVPGSNTQIGFRLYLPANAHPGRWQVMAHVGRSLSSTSETHRVGVPSVGLAQPCCPQQPSVSLWMGALTLSPSCKLETEVRLRTCLDSPPVSSAQLFRVPICSAVKGEHFN